MYVIESTLSGDEPVMLLNAPIGQDPYDPSAAYIDGALFQRQLLEIDGMGKKRIQVWINSPGGVVTDGYNICNAILKSNTPVDTYCHGIAASMAGSVFMCGRKRIMSDYATLMVHNPFDPAGGGDRKQLAALRESLVSMISAKCSIDAKDVAYLMDRETWMSASDCFAKGFCTEIEVTSTSNQKRMPQVGVMAMWKEAEKIQNKILNTTISIPVMENVIPQAKAIGISLIANYLGLNTDASENSVLAAVKEKINAPTLALSKAEDTLAARQKEIDGLKLQLVEKETALSAKVNELTTIQNRAKQEKEDALAAAETAKVEAKKVAAVAMVDKFVGKRIKAEAKDKWVATAIATSVEEVEAMITDLPLNAVAASAAPKKGEEGAVDPNVLPMSAMALMAKVQANTKRKAI